MFFVVGCCCLRHFSHFSLFGVCVHHHKVALGEVAAKHDFQLVQCVKILVYTCLPNMILGHCLHLSDTQMLLVLLL